MTVMIRLGLVAVAAACGSALPAQDRAAALLERHLAWRGGRAAVEALRAIEVKQVVEQGDLEIEMSLAATRDSLRVDYAFDGRKGSFAITPGGCWERDPLGRVVDMASFDADKRRCSLQTLFLRHLVDSGWTRLVRPAEVRGGREWDVLRCVRDGAVIELLLDPAEGSCGFLRMKAFGDESMVELSDWREVNGVRFAYRSAAVDGSKTTVTSSMTTGGEIDARRFARPRADATVEFRGEDWTPIDLTAGGHMFVRGRVGEIDTEVVIDSGAGITVLDRRLAERAGLTGSDTVGTTGVGGTVEAQLVHGVDVAVGNVTVRGITAAVVDLGEIEKYVGRPMPAILGRSLFAGAVVDIDYPNARIAFRDPASFEYDGPGHTVPLRSTDSGLKLVECVLEDAPAAWYQIDTGSGDTVDVFKGFTADHDLLAGRSPTSTKLDGGVGGFAPAIVATARSFTFAGYRLDNVPVAFSRAEDGVFAKSRNAGNLGSGIFDRFRLILDFGRSRMHVEPVADWRARPFRRDRLGLAPAPGEDGKSLDILHVSEGSPAERAGFEAGDHITAIDGKGGDSADLVRRLRALRSNPAGTIVHLTDGDGVEHALVLADYY